MELFVEVVHGADSATDVVLDVEPAATFGDGIAVLLQPDSDSDGDVVGVTLPRRTRAAGPEGRGYLAARGTAELVHVALPDPW